MHRLHSEETLSIRPHFDTPNLRLVVDSIIDGKTPARVWADDLAAPRTVLAWEGRCIYLAGDFEDAEVNKGLREIFSTENSARGSVERTRVLQALLLTRCLEPPAGGDFRLALGP